MRNFEPILREIVPCIWDSIEDGLEVGLWLGLLELGLVLVFLLISLVLLFDCAAYGLYCLFDGLEIGCWVNAGFESRGFE